MTYKNKITAERDELRHQRDALLAAAKAALQWLDIHSPGLRQDEMLRPLRAAIREAEKGS